MLSFYSASNGIVNSQKAMTECIHSALSTQENLNCDLLIIHSTMGHDFQVLLDTAHELCPDARIIGCTCAGVIGIEGANENMRAIAIMAVKTDNSEEISIATCKHISGSNSYESARTMASELISQSPNINMIHILASGIDIAADQAIEGIESVFGRDVAIFGGTSSDNMKAISSFQFSDTEILERGAIVVGYSDPTLELVMGAHHGNEPIGNSFEVTKSEGNKVIELNGGPAWPFIMDQLGMPHDSHPGPCIPFAGIGELLSEPLQSDYDSSHILRVIVKVDKDGSFYMPVDSPVGTKLWITKRNEDLIFKGLNGLLEEIVKKIGEKEIVGVFHTDCAARGRAMFNKVNKDEIIHSMQSAIKSVRPVPWLGMYGYGEFTVLGERNHFHNYTTSLYVLVRQNS